MWPKAAAVDMFKKLWDFFVPSMRCEYCAEDADSESCHRCKVIQLSQGHMITHGQLPPIFWHSIVFNISIHFHSLQKSTHHSRSMEPLAMSLSKCHMVQFSVSTLSTLTRSCLAATHGIIHSNSFCHCSTQLCAHLATWDFFTSQESLGNRWVQFY